MKASCEGLTKSWSIEPQAGRIDVECARFSASAWVGQWRPHTSFRPREEKLSTTSAT